MSEAAPENGLTALGRCAVMQKKVAQLATELAEAAQEPVGELEKACDHFRAYDQPLAPPPPRARAPRSILKRPASAPQIVALSLSHKYFENIVSGCKVAEYRADTNYWKARLLNGSVRAIRFRKGRFGQEVLTKAALSITIVKASDYTDDVDPADRDTVFKGKETAIRIELGATVELASDAD